jgi:hypothetical protein
MPFINLLVAVVVAIGSFVRRLPLRVWDLLMDPRLPRYGFILVAIVFVGVPTGYGLETLRESIMRPVTVVEVQTKTITVHDPGKVVLEHPSATPTGKRQTVPAVPLSAPRSATGTSAHASAMPSASSTSSSPSSLPVPTLSPSATPVQTSPPPVLTPPVSASADPSSPPVSSVPPVTTAPPSVAVSSEAAPSTPSSEPSGS